MSRIGGKPVWADIGPDFDEGNPRNPNDSVFTLVYLAEDYEACAKASGEWMHRALTAERALAEADALLRRVRNEIVEADRYDGQGNNSLWLEMPPVIDAFLAREEP